MAKVNDLLNNDDLAIRDFKLGCKGILDELKAYHTSKKRQIENCFYKLLDNIPTEIINAPINECIEDYLKIIKSKEFESLNSNSNKQDENHVIDQSICDTTISTGTKTGSNMTIDEEIIIGKTNQGFNNLTSTVKKVNNGKLQTLKQKIDEQSIIHEVDIDATPIKDQKQALKPKENIAVNKLNKNDNLAVRVVYFLKDLTQISTKLQDLESIEMKLVHESCADDLKLITKALSEKK